MKITTPRKLIEGALPLDALNVGIKENQRKQRKQRGRSRRLLFSWFKPSKRRSANFHPHSAFLHGVRRAEAGSEDAAQQAARLLAHALDPCVAYRVHVIHA